MPRVRGSSSALVLEITGSRNPLPPGAVPRIVGNEKYGVSVDALEPWQIVWAPFRMPLIPRGSKLLRLEAVRKHFKAKV